MGKTPPAYSQGTMDVKEKRALRAFLKRAYLFMLTSTLM